MIFYEKRIENDEDIQRTSAIFFDQMETEMMIKVFERALNCWSAPPQELVDVLDQMKQFKR